MVKRRGTIKKTGKDFPVIVWERMYSVRGPMGDTSAHVRDSLDELLTDFAADWNRDNP